MYVFHIGRNMTFTQIYFVFIHFISHVKTFGNLARVRKKVQNC